MALSKTDQVLKISLYINAGIWSVFALLSFSGLPCGIPSDLVSRMTIGFLAIGAGGAMVLFRYLAVRYSPRWYYLLLVELMFILFLTIADEFGLPDLIVLISHIITLLAVARKIRIS